MNRIILVVVLLGFLLISFLIFSQGIQKTVTLNVNGQQNEITTSSWRVGNFIDDQGIMLAPGDWIDPSTSTLLFGDRSISVQQASWFTISNIGSIHTVYGIFNTLEELFDSQGINISPENSVFLDGVLTPVMAEITQGSNHSIQIQKSKSLTLTEADNSQTFLTSLPTLGASLWEKKIILSAGDFIDPAIDFPVQETTKAELFNSKDIYIQLADEEIHSNSSASTVGEALSDAGISLQGLDYSRPGESAPIPEDGRIKVIRVNEEQILESETVPFESETQPVADLEIDNRNLVQPGILGLETKRVRVRYEDGQEVSRIIEDEYISQAPQSEIIGYGTKIVPHTLDTPGGQITYWRALEMYAISYNVTSNGGYGTATGVPLAKGVAAIDPRYIAYGTRMYVPGYGEALAADTGGGIQGRMIDLGYTDEDYVSWHQWVTVYFLWPPPENVAWIIP